LILSMAGLTVAMLFGAALWQVLPVVSHPADGVPAEPLLRFGYCGADLQELCLLSFGRDANGNASLNLHVPDDDFPEIYLRINRPNGESVYVCLKEKAGSVLCTGDVIHLNERVEIRVHSAEDFQLLAEGTFTVNAILISAQTFPSATPDDLKTESSE
jgi:hypothetical protein